MAAQKQLNQRSKYKKILFIFLTLILAISLVSLTLAQQKTNEEPDLPSASLFGDKKTTAQKQQNTVPTSTQPTTGTNEGELPSGSFLGNLFGKEEKTWWTKTKEFFGLKEKTWYEKLWGSATSGARTVPEVASILIITGVLYGLGFFWKRAERYNKNPIGWLITLVLLIIFAPRLDWTSWFGLAAILKVLSIIIVLPFKILYETFVIREIGQILWMLFIIDIAGKIGKYFKGLPERMKKAKEDTAFTDGVRTLLVVGKSREQAMENPS